MDIKIEYQLPDGGAYKNRKWNALHNKNLLTLTQSFAFKITGLLVCLLGGLLFIIKLAIVNQSIMIKDIS